MATLPTNILQASPAVGATIIVPRGRMQSLKAHGNERTEANAANTEGRSKSWVNRKVKRAVKPCPSLWAVFGHEKRACPKVRPLSSISHS